MPKAGDHGYQSPLNSCANRRWTAEPHSLISSAQRYRYSSRAPETIDRTTAADLSSVQHQGSQVMIGSAPQ